VTVKLAGTKFKLGAEFAIRNANEIGLSGAVDVRAFGAVGDGVADDAAAVQAALDYALANDKGVYFPGGHYFIDDFVYLREGVSICGDGKAATEIHFGANGRFIFQGASNAYAGRMSIRHMGLTNQGGGPVFALVFGYVTRVTIFDCVVYNTGVSLSGFSYCTFDKCDLFGGQLYADHPLVNEISEALKVSNCNGSGFLVLVKDTADVIIKGTHLIGGASQINIARGEQNSAFYPPVFISDTVVDSGDDEQIVLTGVCPHIRGVFVSGGRTNLKNGMVLTDCTEGGIVDAQVRFCGGHGLFMQACREMTITASTFNDNRLYGVRIGGSSFLRFIGNTMSNAPSWFGGSYVQTDGIADEPSNSTNITLAFNKVTGNSNNSYFLPHASNIIEHNN
jgi:hypothetical protein